MKSWRTEFVLELCSPDIHLVAPSFPSPIFSSLSVFVKMLMIPRYFSYPSIWHGDVAYVRVPLPVYDPRGGRRKEEPRARATWLSALFADFGEVDLSFGDFELDEKKEDVKEEFEELETTNLVRDEEKGDEPEWVTGFRLLTLMTATSIVMFLALLDGSIIGTVRGA